MSGFSNVDEFTSELHARLDHQEILAPHLDFFSSTPSNDGWLSCRAFDRHDSSPSAGVNVHSGVYHDFAHESSMSIFDLLVELGVHATWQEARASLAEQVGLEVPTFSANGHANGSATNGEASGTVPSCDASASTTPSANGEQATGAQHLANKSTGTKSFSEQITLHDPNVLGLGNFAATVNGFCSAKPPISTEGILAVRGRCGFWPKGSVNPHRVIGIPSFRGLGRSASGYILYMADGTPFPAVEGTSLSERKTHLLAGSKDGWILPAEETFKNASTTWKVEGPPDCMALTGVLPCGHVAVSNTHGAQAAAKCPLGLFKGKKLIVIGDCDTAGQQGAEAFALAAARKGIDVRIVKLPFEITPSHGKDVRNFLNEGGTFSELEVLAAEAEPVKPDDGSIGLAGASTYSSGSVGQCESKHVILADAYIDRWMKSGEHLTAVYWREGFHAWDGVKYTTKPDSDVKCEVARFLQSVGQDVTRSLTENVLHNLQAHLHIDSATRLNSWIRTESPPAGNYLAMANGVLSLNAHLAGDDNPLRLHSPHWFSTICLPYEFDPDATCPRWHGVLERNLEGDAERIALLGEWFGYCLTIDTSLQKFLLMHGEGANGKSVVCAVLRAVLGNDNVSSVSLEDFGERFSLHQTLGKLANIAAEIGELDKAAEGYLKSFTSGDPMTFEQKYKSPTVETPTARLTFATNNLPRFSDRSGGLWRRMISLPFRIQIPEHERVPGMDSGEWWMGQGELPGVLNWSVQGLKRLRANQKFTKSQVCDEALAKYRQSTNPARVFLDEHVDYAGPDESDIFSGSQDAPFIKADDLYKNYRSWCTNNGFHPLASSSLGKEISRAFPNVERKKSGRLDEYGKRPYVYENLSWLEDRSAGF